MFDNISPLAVMLLGFAIAGVIELIKRLFDKDYRAATIIVGSAIVGALLAPFAGDVNWFQGLLIGLQASGLITTVSYITKP